MQHNCPEYIVDMVRDRDRRVARNGTWMVQKWLEARKDTFEEGDRIFVPDPSTGRMLTFVSRKKTTTPGAGR